MTGHRPLTIASAACGMRCGRLRSADLVDEAFRVADTVDPVLGIYVSRFDDEARAAARATDTELAAGVDRGILHGIPIAVKDVLATREGPTTACAVVAPRSLPRTDSPAAARLRAAGAVVTGKATTMEFATGLPYPGMPFPLPRNPWDPSRWAGGSSSGSASGVSVGAFLGAIGTDTGGSIRTPASFCGVTGLKPTFGLVPKTGCVTLSDTLDHVGPIARSAADCAVMLAAMAGHDLADPCSARRDPVDYQAGLTGSLHGVRVGVDWENHFSRPVDSDLEAAFRAALDVLAGLGAVLIDVSLPLFAAAGIATIVVSRAEAFSYHAADLRGRPLDYGRGTRISVSRGALASAADYVQAQRVRRRAQVELAGVFEAVDLVIGPTTAFPATRLSELDVERSMTAALTTSFTTYWSAVGNPALAVPIGFNRDGLPLSMQIAGRPFGDSGVLAAGDAYQRLTEWHLCLPPAPESAAAAALPPPAPGPRPPAADRTAVADRLDAAGLVLPHEDVDVLARTHPQYSAAIGSLYAVSAARYETPASLSGGGRGAL